MFNSHALDKMIGHMDENEMREALTMIVQNAPPHLVIEVVGEHLDRIDLDAAIDEWTKEAIMRLLGMQSHRVNGDVVDIVVKCPKCYQSDTVRVSQKQFAQLQSGEGSIQDILPFHSEDERELVQTGTCPGCWDEMFDE